MVGYKNYCIKAHEVLSPDVDISVVALTGALYGPVPLLLLIATTMVYVVLGFRPVSTALDRFPDMRYSITSLPTSEASITNSRN